jgi:hypothetical protein
MTNEIQMFKENHCDLIVTVYDEDDVIIPLDGTEQIFFTVKASTQDEEFLIQKRNDNAGGGDEEINITVPTSGEFEVYLIPADTEDLEPSVYVYDIKMLIDNKQKTIVFDYFYLNEVVNEE